jgi:hypothetical protein
MYNRYKNSSRQNFNSRYEEYVINPFSKEVWGPKMWEVMHTFSFSYPISPSNVEKQAASNFYNSIGILIPCKECSNHCLQYVKINPPNVNSKDDLIDWVYNFHNEVNKRLGKQYYRKEDLLSRYENVAFCNS